MEGFVEKRSTTLTGAAKYQSRYFVLSSHYLRYTKKYLAALVDWSFEFCFRDACSYYSDKTRETLKGSFDIHEMQV